MVHQLRRKVRLGGELLDLGGVALIIDAKNQRVAAWYQQFGALAMLDHPLTLMLLLMTVRVALVKPCDANVGTAQR